MDRKRVNGPEASVAPIFKKAEEDVNVLSSDKKRLDSRGVEDLRPICKYFTCDILISLLTRTVSFEDWTHYTSKRISIHRSWKYKGYLRSVC